MRLYMRIRFNAHINFNAHTQYMQTNPLLALGWHEVALWLLSPEQSTSELGLMVFRTSAMLNFSGNR